MRFTRSMKHAQKPKRKYFPVPFAEKYSFLQKAKRCRERSVFLSPSEEYFHLSSPSLPSHGEWQTNTEIEKKRLNERRLAFSQNLREISFKLFLKNHIEKRKLSADRPVSSRPSLRRQNFSSLTHYYKENSKANNKNRISHQWTAEVTFFRLLIRKNVRAKNCFSPSAKCRRKKFWVSFKY